MNELLAPGHRHRRQPHDPAVHQGLEGGLERASTSIRKSPGLSLEEGQDLRAAKRKQGRLGARHFPRRGAPAGPQGHRRGQDRQDHIRHRPVMGLGMEHWHPNPDFFFLPGGGPILDMGPYYIANLINLIGPVSGSRRCRAGRARRGRFPRASQGREVTVKTPTTIMRCWSSPMARSHAVRRAGTSGARPSPRWSSMAPTAPSRSDPNFFGGEVQVAGTDTVVKAPCPPGITPSASTTRKRVRRAMRSPITARRGLADMASAIMAKSRRALRHRAAAACGGCHDGVHCRRATSGKFVSMKTKCTRPKLLAPEEARALLK